MLQDLLTVDGDCRTSVIVTPTTNPSHDYRRALGGNYPWSGPLQHIHCVSRLLPPSSDMSLRAQLMDERVGVEEDLEHLSDGGSKALAALSGIQGLRVGSVDVGRWMAAAT